MNRQELSTLLHELISEQNKCDSELYFEKKTNFDKRDDVMKKILDLNDAWIGKMMEYDHEESYWNVGKAGQ